MSTLRGPVQVLRQQWRSQRPGSPWEMVWAARRRGQVDWRHAPTAREAIRQAVLAGPGKAPPWLIEAAAAAEAKLNPRGAPATSAGIQPPPSE